MEAYLYIAMFAAIGSAFVAATLLIARVLRPVAPNPDKLETYECGPLPRGDAWRQFNMHHYLFALLFVAFDVEAVFLYPWAMAYQQFGLYAIAEMFIFVGLLVFGWFYAWRRGALEWE